MKCLCLEMYYGAREEEARRGVSSTSLVSGQLGGRGDAVFLSPISRRPPLRPISYSPMRIMTSPTKRL